jgi:sirohydrochlorin cobaltochelatase
MLKKGTIIVSFGTSENEAGKNSLERIYQDIEQENQGDFLVQAYTSEKIIEKLAKEKIVIPTVEQALYQAKSAGVEKLLVIPTFMIAGQEYHKLLDILQFHQSNFKEIRMTSPVLYTKEDCKKLVPILKDIYQFQDEIEYILMGHGSNSKAQLLYEQMNQEFIKSGLANVRIVCLNQKELLDGCKYYDRKKIVLHPFLVVAGNHVQKDLDGQEGSIGFQLKEAGHEVEVHRKGLGEYEAFRKIYVKKFNQ